MQNLIRNSKRPTSDFIFVDGRPDAQWLPLNKKLAKIGQEGGLAQLNSAIRAIAKDPDFADVVLRNTSTKVFLAPGRNALRC